MSELAYHYARSTDYLKAVKYLTRAAWQAMGGGPTKKPKPLCVAGCGCLVHFPKARIETAKNWGFRSLLRACGSALKGYGSRERLEPSLSARKLCLRLGDRVRLVPVLKNLGDVFYNNEQYDRCREIIKELAELGDQTDDPVAGLVGTYLSASVCWSIGDFSEARNCSEQVLLQSERLRGWLASMRIWTMSYRCLSLAALGYLDRARGIEGEMLAESDNSYHRAVALRTSSILNVILGDGVKAEAAATQLKQIATEEYRTLAQWGAECHGWAIAAQGSVDEGIAELFTVDEISLGGSTGFHCRALSDSYLSGKDALKALEWARSDWQRPILPGTTNAGRTLAAYWRGIVAC